MALRIAMIAYTHYESDPRVRREAEALAGRGDSVTVWCLRAEGFGRNAIENGVRVVRVDLPRYRGGRAIAYASSYARFLVVVAGMVSAAHVESAFDVVHVHTMPDFMVFAALVPRLTGAKVLLDMHDLMPELYALKFKLAKDGVAVSVLRMMQRAATAFADAVICVHQNQYELLLRDGVPAYKLGIVMNAADPALFPRRAKEPPAGPGDRIRVVYHGTVLERYGVDLLVRAFALARARDPRLVMSIYGGGDFVEPVLRLARELGLDSGCFEMEGRHRPLDEIARLIRDAHIGVAPNRDDQEDSVLPTKLLEYVAVGIPAVATRTRCISRFFDGSEVELVEVGDVEGMAEAIVRIASDGKRRKQMIERAHAWEDEYGFAVNREHLFRTIDALCFEKLEKQRLEAKAAAAAAAPPKESETQAPVAPTKPAKPKSPAKQNAGKSAAPSQASDAQPVAKENADASASASRTPDKKPVAKENAEPAAASPAPNKKPVAKENADAAAIAASRSPDKQPVAKEKADAAAIAASRSPDKQPVAKENAEPAAIAASRSPDTHAKPTAKENADAVGAPSRASDTHAGAKPVAKENADSGGR